MDELALEAENRNERKRKRSSEGSASSGCSPQPTEMVDNSSISHPVTNGHNTEGAPIPAKKSRLGSSKRGQLPGDGPPSVQLDRSTIPGEVWQHVFTFLPPTSLGRSLRVNRCFHTLLTTNGPSQSPQFPSSNVLSFQSKDSVWAAARRLFFPGMPRPLQSLDELEMWRLLRTRSCQFCGKAGSPIPPKFPAAPWDSGPGDNDVRIIWPFNARACGACLKTRMQKEMELLFSSTTPTVLLPALPFAFFTQTLDYVAALTLRNTSPPPDKPLTKFYFQSHLEEMKQKFAEAKTLGTAAAEEWFKGLESTGKAKLADAARWEQWESIGGLHDLLSWKDTQVEIRIYPRVSDSSTNINKPQTTMLSTAPQATQMSIGETPTPRLVPNSGVSSGLPAKPQAANTSYTNFTFPQVPRPVPPLVPIQPHVPQHRAERSIKDVNDAKAARRADIERRCQELDPPIPPSVLIHMDSFAAAIQIPVPMNENAWEVLKPRLLAQRDIAEQREQEQRMQSQLVQRMTEERRQQEASLKEAKENLDREWDEVQKPVREKVNIYADEIIQNQWRGGAAVTKDLCPKFAADVLTYVRERFYYIQQQEDTALVAAGRQPRQDLPNVAPTRSLILENMKSVFDAKVRPYTEPHQKEIFLCNGCDTTAKWYGFEGVVQHYAAKHTSSLSSGTIVVWWRAEWPETPPFNPNPTPSKGSYGAPFGIGGESTTGLSASALPVPHLSGNQQTYDQHQYPGDRQSSYPHPSPYPHDHSQYAASHYSQQSTGYRTESPASAAFQIPGHGVGYQFAGSPSADYRHSPFTHDSRYALYQPGHPGYQPFSPYGQSPGFPPDPRSNPSYAYTQSYPPRVNGPPYPPQHSRPQLPAASFGGQSGLSAPGQPLGIYQVQLEELARNAREVWDGTSGIQNLPSSVRIHVIINHVVLRFKDRFTNEPNLALFTEGLNSSSQMKPIRNLSDLTCKACFITSGGFDSFSHPNGPPIDTKLHTLPALLAHFQSVHVEQNRLQIVPQTGIEPPRLDWKFDMVQLPDASVIKEFLNAPGMTNSKLSLIATVIPGVFPTPLPKIESPAVVKISTPVPSTHLQGASGVINGSDTSRVSYSPAIRGDLRSSQTRISGIEVAVDNFPKFIESPTHSSAEPAEPAKDDEYDPHRPAYIEPPRDQYGRIEHSRSRYKPSPSQTLAAVPFQDELLGRPSAVQNPIPSQKPESPHHPDIIATGDAHLIRSDSASQHNQRAMVQNFTKSQSTSQPTSHPESISAAEHFLNNFDPNDEREEYRSLGDAGRGDPAGPSGQQWSPNVSSPVSGERDRQGIQLRYDDRAQISVHRHMTNNTPREADSFRYSQVKPPYHDPHVVVEAVPRRPDSRFDRYSAQRHDPQRSRSRSPRAAESSQQATIYYRERSPPPSHYQRHNYSPNPPIDGRNEYALHESQPANRLPPNRQYQYVEDARFEEPYGTPVEYVRIAAREPSASGRYYMERPIQSGVGDAYRDYDREYRREQVFEHNGQLYTRAAPPPDRHDPYTNPSRIRYL